MEGKTVSATAQDPVDSKTDGTRETLLVRWNRIVEIPLIVISVIFLLAYAVPILHQDLPGPARSVCTRTNQVIWGLFLLDYGVRFHLSPRKIDFLRGNWIDLMILALPMFRPLRPLRALLVLRLISRRTQKHLRGQVLTMVSVTVASFGAVSALAVLEAERGQPDASILTFEDALWWVLTTVTTVGYGDRYPTTTTGRLIAAVLMLMGIALLSVVTATVASWFVDRISEVRVAEERTEESLGELLREIHQLREEVAALKELRSERPD
ncbi:MAG: voltage-gated potassium channel [Actinomycetota bacterium]|nr:voltage-gated potassium channel [Actinomycetota bacterium]